MGVRSIDLEVDVTEAARLGEPAHVALTITVPDDLASVGADGATPVVCFAKPGAGYSRGYYTTDLPGPGPGVGAQADWHAERGWIFVSVDHLGVGGSSLHGPDALGFAPVVAASEAAESDVVQKLAAGTLIDGLGKIERPVKIGLGQSMGACLTVVQQGRFHSYDGVGVLGYGVLGTLPPTAPGTPDLVLPWMPRDAAMDEWVMTNAPALAALDPATSPGTDAMAWGFHYDDMDRAVVARDMDDYPTRHGDLPRVGVGDDPEPADHVVRRPGRGDGRGGRDHVARPGGDGRAGRGGRPPWRGAGLCIVAERRLVCVSEDGAHAQLCGDARGVLASYRDVGGLGAGVA